MRVSKPMAVILCVEGTTIPRNYLTHTLFPFFRNNIGFFFRETYQEPITRMMIERLRKAQLSLQATTESPQKQPKPIPAEEQREGLSAALVSRCCCSFVQYLQECHRERVELKEVKVLMWVWALDNGLLTSQVFDDVAPTLHEWKYDHNIRIFIQSSVLKLIQQLFFVKCNKGNLLPLIDEFLCPDESKPLQDISLNDEFVTYRWMVQHLKQDYSIEHPTHDALYITDNIREASAASRFFKTLVLQRDGKSKQQKFISSLEDISFK